VDCAGEPMPTVCASPFQQTLLVAGEAPGLRLPAHWELANLGRLPLRRLYLGTLGLRACYAFEYGADTEAPPGMPLAGAARPVRRLDDSLFALAGRALQYIDWDRTHQFCGRCGTPCATAKASAARECPACRLIAYPRIAPAVMCWSRAKVRSCSRARRTFCPACTARSPASSNRASRWSSASRARCWRKPASASPIRAISPASPGRSEHSLMIAFVADYAAGEITPAPDEIEDAQCSPGCAAETAQPDLDRAAPDRPASWRDARGLAAKESEIDLRFCRCTISAIAAPEPQAMVQPRVPWPVLSSRFGSARAADAGHAAGVRGRSPAQNCASSGRPALE